MSARDHQTVGFVGLGDMGGPMAQRIAEAGFPLQVFDLRPEAMASSVSSGAIAADTPTALVAASDVVVVCLVNDGQILNFVEQTAESFRPGSVFVVTSSVKPATMHEVADVLGKRDVAVIDAPVTGSRPAVAAGTLTLMVGGADADVDRVLPVLEAFGGRLFRVGAVGAGQAVKIANNIMLHMNHLVALEAIRFARSEGIDEAVLLDVVNVGSGRSWVTETWGLIDDMLRDHPQAGTPGIYDMMVKEMWNAVVMARATRTSLPLTALGVQEARPLLVERERTLGLVPAEERQ